MLESPDVNSQSAVVRLPDEFGTIDAVIRPLEREIVRTSGETQRGRAEPDDSGSIQDRIGVTQSLHDKMPSGPTGNPTVQRREAHCRNGLEYVRLAVTDQHESHVTVRGAG